MPSCQIILAPNGRRHFQSKYFCEAFIKKSRDDTKNQLPNVVVKSAIGLVEVFEPVCQALII